MKLITELNESVNVLTEERDGKKHYFIEGVFMQAGIKNRNGRVYPAETLEKEVSRYVTENVKQNRAYGELGHPSGPTINLERVSHMIKDIRKEGNDYIGKAKIMDTPFGLIVQNLISEGANLGVSSRGLGSLKESNGIMEVQQDFHLATAGDIVADPSAPGAFVRGIMEGTEYWFDDKLGTYVPRTAEQLRDSMKKMSTRQINEQKVELFSRYLNALAKR